MPLVSVIVSAHNCQHAIAPTLRSLLDQSLTDWEAVVIDCASTDDTPGILADFQWRDRRIRVVRQGEPGAASARNLGLAEAAGDYVCVIEPGTVVTPLGIERLLQTAEWSGAGAACGPVALHGTDGRALGLTLRPSSRGVGTDELLADHCLVPGFHLIKRRTLGATRYDERLPACAELQFRLRLAGRGIRWESVDETVAAVRVHPAARSRNIRLLLDTVGAVYTETAARGPARAGAIRRAALLCASITALAEPTGGAARALPILRSGVPGPAAFSPAELGTAASWALLLGFGVPPRKVAPSAGAWRPRLREWWQTLGQCGERDALRALAAATVHPGVIATAMLDGLEPGRPAVLAGALGENGRVVSALARTRGIRLAPRDDRLPRAAIERLLDATSTVLVAPRDDRQILAKLPEGIRTIRWSETHDRLSEEVLKRFDSAASARDAAVGA